MYLNAIFFLKRLSLRADAARDFSCHVLRLLKTALELPQIDQVTLRVLCPQAFCFSSLVIRNHFICRIQNILRRTVILLQFNDLRCLESFTYY